MAKGRRRVTNVPEQEFVRQRRSAWNALDELATVVAQRQLSRLSSSELSQLSPHYRDACADLARARAAHYSSALIEELEERTRGAHDALYAAPRRARSRITDALVAFPRAVRRRRRAVALAALLFFVPLLFGLGMTLHDPSFAYEVAPESMLRPLAQAYRHGFSEGRALDQDSLMAGFYVNNNVGIALRCFALGIFGGIGSAFYLIQNGLSIGAILGYVASEGAGDNIVTFIAGHGSFELGAIVLAGGAGLSMGWSVVAPGEKTRVRSLQDTSRDVLAIVVGAAVMLLIAAGLEAFWSSSSAPALVKRGLGALGFLALVGYLGVVGRERRVRE
jgi:uncharacterized membrane protein SpoIIM required for sporulation